MNRNTGGAILSIVKWVVVPIGLAALGFYVVGPRVAQSYLATVRTPVAVVSEPVDEEEPTRKGEPKVQVKSEKLKTQPTRRRRSSSRPPETSRAAPAPVEDSPEEPSPEPASEPGDDTSPDGEGGNGIG